MWRRHLSPTLTTPLVNPISQSQPNQHQRRRTGSTESNRSIPNRHLFSLPTAPRSTKNSKRAQGYGVNPARGTKKGQKGGVRRRPSRILNNDKENQSHGRHRSTHSRLYRILGSPKGRKEVWKLAIAGDNDGDNLLSGWIGRRRRR